MPKVKKKYVFTILGIPSPKQSFRFTRTGHKYQTAKVVQGESNNRTQVIQQLPKGFKILDCPLKATFMFVYPFTKSFKKADLEEAKKGKIFYKSTRPDLMDNLMKGYMDSLNGVVFIDDALICKTGESEKRYGETPKTVITIETLD